EYAENLILQERHTSLFYLATMQAFDEECRVRIERHRALRAGKGFETLECPVGLHKIHLPIASAVLLECIGNLVANELYSSTGAGEMTLSAILEGVESLRRQCETLVVVTNDVHSGAACYEKETLRYMRLLGELNRALAFRADDVCEVVCGIPCYYKRGGHIL
ncbi:bifunctional adenosylcobinamide kinase/adenosylcobinamide-phosphate guanylyltransferase, partial [uncultured Ruthenibacterium sp.]|uniref:bifunctional adenosylcobinamide kinase/adenosylcobinamide-phosphate guanylyltransferase n=1 Tax=uncultured Ruthenibacterium sp. TaxID=1905347 RepID=UPI00349E5C58